MNSASFIIRFSKRFDFLTSHVLNELKNSFGTNDAQKAELIEAWKRYAPEKLHVYFDQSKIIAGAEPNNIAYFLFENSNLDLANEITTTVVLFWDNEDIDFSINSVITNIKKRLPFLLVINVLENEKLNLIPYSADSQDIWGLKHALTANIKKIGINKKSVSLLTLLFFVSLLSVILWLSQFFHNPKIFSLEKEYLLTIDSFLIGVSGSFFVSFIVELIKEWEGFLSLFKLGKYKGYQITLSNLSNLLRPIQRSSKIKETDLLALTSRKSRLEDSSSSKDEKVESSPSQESPSPNKFDEKKLEKIIDLLEECKYDEAIEVFDSEIPPKFEDEVEKLENKIHFCLVRYKFGDKDAIQDAKRLSESSSSDFIKQYAELIEADCYLYTQDYQAATKIFGSHLDSEHLKVQQRAYEGLIEAYSSLDEHDNIFNLVFSNFSSVPDDVKVILLMELGDYYAKRNHHLIRAILYEKALELKANDTQILFGIAYSYSQLNKDGYEFSKQLTLLFYSIHAKVNNNEPIFLNNYGIALREMGLKYLSRARLQESMKKGTFLSLNNYINALKDGGYASIVNDLIGQYLEFDIEKDDYDKAYSIKAEVQGEISNERNNRDSYIEDAGKVRAFMSNIWKHIFTPRDLSSGDFLEEENWMLIDEQKGSGSPRNLLKVCGFIQQTSLKTFP